MLLLATFLAVSLYCLVHLFVGRLGLLDREPHQSNWVSFAGGVAIAYVFVYFLPGLAAKQGVLQASTDGGIFGFLEHHVYLVAVAGLTVAFGFARAGVLLRAAAESGRKLPKGLRQSLESYEIAGASGYYALAGYLVSELTKVSSVALMSTAMVLHFAAIDHGFVHRDEDAYRRKFRWVFCAATLAGWALGAATVVSPLVIAVWTAFMAGAIIVNALREELPGESQLRFWPFFLGVTFFAAAVLVVRYIESG